MFNATTDFEFREFNEKKNKKKNNMDKLCKIVVAVTWTERGIFMENSIHILVFTCSIPYKLKHFLLYGVGGGYKNHSNPYIHSTIVPCDRAAIISETRLFHCCSTY